MTTQAKTNLEQEIAKNREELAEARAAEKALKVEIDQLPEAYREAKEEGRRAAEENHRRWVAARKTDTGADTERRRGGNHAHRAEQLEITAAPIRRVEQAEKLLRSEYREARARVADLEAQSWEMERARVRAETNVSDLDQREQEARRKLAEVEGELETIQAERTRIEGVERRATRERHNALRMAKQLRSGAADMPGFEFAR